MAVVVSGEADCADFGEGRGIETSARGGEGEVGNGESAAAAAGEVGLEREDGRSAGRSDEVRGPMSVNVAGGLAAAGQGKAQSEQGGQGECFEHRSLLRMDWAI